MQLRVSASRVRRVPWRLDRTGGGSRKLHRKDKALAETAALLVLSKKLAAVFHEGEDA